MILLHCVKRLVWGFTIFVLLLSMNVATTQAANLQSTTNKWINTAHTASTYFLEGTPVNLRADGSVFSGTIALQSIFWINTAHTASAAFKAGSFVNFRDDGSVSSGVITQPTEFWINSAYTASAVFRKDTVVNFREDGSVSSGIIDK